MYVSSTLFATARPNGTSGGMTFTLTATFWASATPTTAPEHPRYLPLVRTTWDAAGNRSCNCIGPLSMKRGSGAGDCQRASCSGTSASSFPNTFFVEPLAGFVFIPCNGRTLIRTVISPISTPPDPGIPVPWRYPCLMVSASANHVSLSFWLYCFVVGLPLTSRTSQDSSEMQTTRPSCIMGQFTNNDFPSTLPARTCTDCTFGI
mmetsp:Transcript_18506/g.52905  ORF Transcript_18506/g.52905 Transcript_18506/m.52905 type:complete len:205 (-) Transcript_18506:1298-1912(-)